MPDPDFNPDEKEAPIKALDETDIAFLKNYGASFAQQHHDCCTSPTAAAGTFKYACAAC
jgi:hypothetical protein